MPSHRTPDELPDHYAVLGVPADATAQQITRAFRTLVRVLHPDTAPAGAKSAVRFIAVTTSYSILHDPARRAAYDEVRGQPDIGAQAPAPPPTRTPRPRPAPCPPAQPFLRVGPVRVSPLISRDSHGPASSGG